LRFLEATVLDFATFVGASFLEPVDFLEATLLFPFLATGKEDA
jgi:hypothetical protein